MSRSFSKMRFLSLFAIIVVLALTLAACGEENKAASDNSFTLPVYNGLTEVPALASSTDFKSKVLPEDKNFSEKSVRVFTTNAALSDVKSYYSKELPNAGWTNRSTTLLGPDTLGANGWVLGFEKPAGNTTSRSRGIIMVGPNTNGTNDFLKTYRDNGTLPSGQNVVVVVDGLYSANGATPAPTATPKA